MSISIATAEQKADAKAGAVAGTLGGTGIRAAILLGNPSSLEQEITVAIQDAIYQSVFLTWLPPRVASLAFAITFVLLWYGILLVLYRRKIILKV